MIDLTNPMSASLEANAHFNLSAKFFQIAPFFSEIYIYIVIIFAILFLIILSLYITSRRKRQVLEKVYRKLSDADKQVFHVVRATENQTLPTLQNILLVFWNINSRKLTMDQLLQHLYRLESVGLVNISISNLRGQSVQICTSLYSNKPISESISKHYKLFSSIFLPISIGSLAICYYLLQVLDSIVHGDLYGYGLVFSYEWANQYWNITALMRSSLSVALLLLGVSAIFTLINFYSYKKGLKIVNCIFFIVAIILVSYSVFLLSELDYIVNYDLYYFGLQFSYQWAEKYWTYIALGYSLLGISIVANLVCFIFCIYSKPNRKNN